MLEVTVDNFHGSIFRDKTFDLAVAAAIAAAAGHRFRMTLGTLVPIVSGLCALTDALRKIQMKS